MAQLGKFERTILDNQGDPLSGISVAIYNQGASLSAAGTNPYTVYDPGALTTAYTVQRNTSSAQQKAVTVVGATSITVQGIGLGSLVANDRLVAVSPVPTLYFDATGVTSTGSNILTTDANGYCTCWLLGGAYDVIVSGTGYSTRLTTDFIVSAEKRQSNALDASNTPLWIFGSSRTLGLSPIVEWHNPTGSRKAYITALGDFNGRQGIFSSVLSTTSNFMVSGTSTLIGNTTVGGTFGVTGATTLAGLTATTGTFSSTLTASNGFTISAGTISLPTNALSKTSIATGTTDVNQGAGTAYTTIAGDGNASLVQLVLTPASTTSEFLIMANVPLTCNAAGSIRPQVRIKNSATVLHEVNGYVNGAGNTDGQMVTCIARQTGLTGAQTWTLEVGNIAGAGTSQNILSNSTDRKAKLIVIEHKF